MASVKPENLPSICCIGFGEAGQTFAKTLRDAGITQLSTWDILFPKVAGRKLVSAADSLGVHVGKSMQDALADADIVFSAVTASSSQDVAREARPYLKADQFFFDINSVSPGRKAETYGILHKHVKYLDLAVMAPVHPNGHRTPCLIAGEHAAEATKLLHRLGMNVSISGPEIGSAAAIKMIRSVMIKGLEALTFECFAAARKANVEEQIFASLTQSFPNMDWHAIGTYNLNRMLEHGLRRAAEMREVAITLQELGVDPCMSGAASVHQQALGELKILSNVTELAEMLDMIERLKKQNKADSSINAIAPAQLD